MGAAPRVLAVTSRVPYSANEEAFVQEELETMLGAGADLIVVPIRLATSQPNDAAIASGLAKRLRAEPLISAAVVAGAVRTLLRRPGRSLAALARVIGQSGGARNRAANLAVLPKALWLADLCRREGVGHIHSYWYSHTSTAAWVASQITRIPWSATGYRWDIDTENALRLKARSAEFLRVADELGHRQMSEKLADWGEADCPLPLVRTGVAMPAVSDWSEHPVDLSLLCCAAAFVPKKGHLVLIEALSGLVESGRDLTLHLMGDGPLLGQVKAAVAVAGLDERVVFHGVLPLEELRGFLLRHRPVLVLPSIRAEDGQEEGIPVVLIEAMASGSPVVSTRTGSIPALVLDGCGTLVADRDAAALEAAIAALIDDPAGAEATALRARRRVEGEFTREASAARMLELFAARRDRSEPVATGRGR